MDEKTIKEALLKGERVRLWIPKDYRCLERYQLGRTRVKEQNRVGRGGTSFACIISKVSCRS